MPHFTRINPITGDIASTAYAMKAADMPAIAARAGAAFPAWAAMGPNARRTILAKAAYALLILLSHQALPIAARASVEGLKDVLNG